MQKYLQQADFDQDTIAAFKKETETLKKMADIDSKLHDCQIKKIAMDNEMKSSISTGNILKFVGLFASPTQTHFWGP